ncbi:MAG: ATP-binding protein [Patescibacteria group bacterium]
MFTSATLKLTAWYLIILITICLIFSFIIFELSTSEISNRLERLQIRAEGSSQVITLPGPLTLTDVRENQTEEARTSIFIGLVYMNLAVITLGGAGSYLLARRTLKPIEEAHEAQSRFTADASHELRTPLAVMKSEIQVALRTKNMKNVDYKDLLESNLEEVDKLAQLSQSLLQLSRLEYGDLERTDRVNIVLAVEKAAKSLHVPTARLSYVIPAQQVVIDGNQSIIGDLFRILLDNAVKYSPPHSLIAIVITSNGRTCKVVMTNEGTGIQKRDIVYIFDRFFRGEKSRTTSHTTGYGLGLSLARKIVNMHDGSISVRSTPQKTTSFTVQLPEIRNNR